MSISLDEMITLIQAHKDGKEIEFRRPNAVDDSWKPYDLSRELARGFELRIKPEPPKSREWWIIAETSELESFGGATLYNCKQILLDNQVQVHVREVLPEEIP